MRLAEKRKTINEMYAIVEIAGQQFKVEEGKKIFVHKLEAEIESQVEFDRVLLIENGDKITVGTPIIEKALVEAKVLDQVRGDKVLVFKKKRRKGYQKLNGHRQYFTQVEITAIQEKASDKKRSAPAEKAAAVAPETKTVAAEKAVKETAPEKVTDKKAATEKAPVKKEAPVKESAGKKAPAKKTPAKKAPAKKAPAKKTATAKATEKKAPAKKATPKKKTGGDSGKE